MVHSSKLLLCLEFGQPGASSSFGDLDKVVLQVFAGVAHQQNGWDGKVTWICSMDPTSCWDQLASIDVPVSLTAEESRDAREPGQASYCPGSKLMYGSTCTQLTTDSITSFPPTVEKELLLVVGGPATDTSEHPPWIQEGVYTSGPLMCQSTLAKTCHGE